MEFHFIINPYTTGMMKIEEKNCSFELYIKFP